LIDLIFIKGYNETFIKDFRNNRIKFESHTKDFNKTYLLLEKHYNMNMRDIKELELHIEQYLSFLIVKHLKNVKQDDI
jgi:hypothetical protein